MPRSLICATLVLILAACASDPAPLQKTAPTTTVPAGAVLTGPLTARVKNRAVLLQWEEDEYQYHCLTLTQDRPGKTKPAELVICPNDSGWIRIFLPCFWPLEATAPTITSNSCPHSRATSRVAKPL